MLSASDIPVEWRQLLGEINNHTRAVIAGGALRDLDHDIKPKDLDIFMECGDEEEASGLNQLLGGKWGEQEELKWYPESMREVILVSDYDKKKDKLSTNIDIPVQFIFCNWKIDKILTRFDYACCQIGFDGKDVFYEQGYTQDKENKTMTLRRCGGESALMASVERFGRWKHKYPEHKWRLGCHLSMGSQPIDMSLT